jgi:hypothetical protein
MSFTCSSLIIIAFLGWTGVSCHTKDPPRGTRLAEDSQLSKGSVQSSEDAASAFEREARVQLRTNVIASRVTGYADGWFVSGFIPSIEPGYAAGSIAGKVHLSGKVEFIGVAIPEGSDEAVGKTDHNSSADDN